MGKTKGKIDPDEPSGQCVSVCRHRIYDYDIDLCMHAKPPNIEKAKLT